MKRPQDYYLMHKDIPVCLMEISEDGKLSRVRRIEDTAAHFPLGGQMNNMKFHDWWRDRAIPKTRHGAKTALQRLGYSSTDSALVNNLALSLTDCYWILPRGENLSWKDVNLFTNDFVDSFGEITINQSYTVDLRRVTRFNCATSQGELQKKWCIDSTGRRYMVKGNYGESYQQSLNEVFATKLHEGQADAQYTPYSLVRLQVDEYTEGLGCLCYDCCSEDIEWISAWELLQTVKTRQNESLFYPLKSICLNLGMTDEQFHRFMDYEIMTDYLISNTDRHMNNIAVMRDPDTLQILGFAPIFDSGNSMFYNVPLDSLSRVRFSEIRTHSFIERECRLLQYVQNRQAVDLARAENADFSLYEQDISERHGRIPILKDMYSQKLDMLSSFQFGKDIWREENMHYRKTIFMH